MDAKANRDYLLDRALAAGITEPRELAHFMGQMQIECGGFGRMSENLNYSGERLRAVFPNGRNGMDTLEEANAVAAGGPRAVAEKIYGGEWGARKLGNTEPGDGWQFHGRGYVQLTGRSNYASAGNELGLDLINHPELAADPKIAADIAVHYWIERVRTRDAESDVTAATRAINGGQNHLAERRAATAEWEDRLANGYLQANGITGDGSIPPPEVSAPSQSSRRTATGNTSAAPAAAFADGMFNLGDRGVGVEVMQRQLIQAGYTGKDGQPLKPDGDFGPNTKHAVEELQRAHGLQVDGKAGMDSLRALADELQNGRPAPKLPEPERAPGRFEDASLGTDPLFQSLRGHVHTMDRAIGRTPDDASDRVAAALCAECRANGLTRVDGVVLGQKGGSAQPGEYVFAYSGSSERPSDWVGVRTAEAVQTPVEQSLAKAETLQRQQAMEAQQMAQAQQPANDAPVISMG
ncbi:XVIPCD domain-containing protein [Silanimonas sp.]|jgi:putative chitinase|uniref:XVIPCD domain-containing protein n=1 Tax=Silanimonas sp. TaxID=1929290 RepID=UPI0037C92C22